MAFLGELAAQGEVAGCGGQVTICPQDECGLLDLDTVLGAPEPGTAVYCCGPAPLLAAAEVRCCLLAAGRAARGAFHALASPRCDRRPRRGPRAGYRRDCRAG